MSVTPLDVVSVLQALTQAGVTSQQLTELYNKSDLTREDVMAILDKTEAAIERVKHDD